ncbi:MAG TPA: hypothetical protein VLF19_10710 [Methylomirabilota bacterium]|nr:hypothetical protein [Methylomirabilota bacterium]
MLDTSADAVLRALNRAYMRRPVLAMVLAAVFGLAVIEGLAFGAPAGATLLFGSLAVLAVVVVSRREIEYYSEAVEYVLDDHATVAYRSLVTAFSRLKTSGPIWHLGRRTTDGQRRHRRLVVPVLALPPRVRSNIRVPALRAGRQTLYFFPDRILVYDTQMAWGIEYRDLKVKGGDVREVTEIGAGGDWAECNGFLALMSRSGLSALFRCADVKAAAEVASALEGLA